MSGGDYDGGNTTGFVSPASDSLEGPIDLSEILDLRRPHRYPVRVRGDALVERGIRHGDILIADAAAPPAPRRVVIAMVHGDVLVCQLALKRGSWWLKPTVQQPLHAHRAIRRVGEAADEEGRERTGAPFLHEHAGTRAAGGEAVVAPAAEIRRRQRPAEGPGHGGAGDLFRERGQRLDDVHRGAVGRAGQGSEPGVGP
ncbi:hypothetical protein GCM10009416_11900 [Craurococcus roseus]|uniref:Peptidase S24/S26A/S26B/S26C domain-containing protein n=1 Tax=Craurococcus roseus TaxID=77585 RepID=A0ABP3PY65_9PROT